MRKLDRFNNLSIKSIEPRLKTLINLREVLSVTLCNPVYASVFSHSINVLDFPDGYYRNGIFSWC